MSIASDAHFWDRASRKYARSRISDPTGYERTLERTRVHLQPEYSVLELGCGTGTTALRLAVSGGMIAIANEKFAVEPIPALSFRTATAEELVHEESRFDAVLGFNYLHMVRDVPDTLRSIHALLKPGGLYISKTPCLGDMNPLIPLLLLPVMRAIGKAPHVSSFSTSTLQQSIVNAGFDVMLRESHASKGRDQRPYIVARKR
jgi:ubiquinone/menaquinone biosynthesis C-methylase UbiE